VWTAVTAVVVIKKKRVFLILPAAALVSWALWMAASWDTSLDRGFSIPSSFLAERRQLL